MLDDSQSKVNSSSMRVFHIWARWRPEQCGISDYLNRLLPALRELGVDVSLLSCTQDQDKPTAHYAEIPLCLGSTWGFRAAWRALAILKREYPEIVHVQYVATGYGRGFALLWLYLAAQQACPSSRWVTTFHEVSRPALFRGAHKLGFDRLAFRALVASSASVITTNSSYAEIVARARRGRGQSKLDVHVIPIGSNIPQVHTTNASELRRRYGLTPQDIVFSYFGLFRRGKGLPYLLQAFAMVIKRIPNARLLLIGNVRPEDGPTYQQLTQECQELGIGESIIWAQGLTAEDISSLLQVTDVYVLPFRDGFNLNSTSFTTAVVHHLPIVTTQGPQSPTEFVDGESLLLVEPRNAQALAKAMQAVATSPELRDRLRRSMATLASQFDWDRIALRTLDVYRSVLNLRADGAR